MANQNQQLANLEHLVTHKKHVIDSMHKVARFFIKRGDKKRALNFMEKSFYHDMSKLFDDEFDGYSAATTFDKNGKKRFDPQALGNAWEKHYKRNYHHPEYWSKSELGLDRMTEDAIIEMCCDWHAMSKQFNDSANDFYQNRAKDEHQFNQDQDKTILFYLDVLEHGDY